LREKDKCCGRLARGARESGALPGNDRWASSPKSTARTQTEWLLSVPMRPDLSRKGIDWSQLFDVPTTVFVIMPAEYLDTQEGSVWLRLIVMSALRPLYGLASQHRVGEVVFLLSEFPALKKLTAA
jgi:type IV secretory pathway TraG/TraD family ATPase VirD4